jgi:Uma2 family endonuclease
LICEEGGSDVASLLLLDEDVEIPLGIENVAEFRLWALSDDFPERGRFDYINGRLEVDLAPRNLFSHCAVTTELMRALGNHLHEHDFGFLYTYRCRYSSLNAGLSVQPDVFFFTYETIDSKRARLIPNPNGEPESCVEVEGAIDLTVEIVDNASENKDRERLPPAYFKAGVREFWLIDARGKENQFQIHHRGETEYQPATTDEEGFQFSQVFKRRYKLERDCKTQDHWQYDLREIEV